jgi:hypothetical protein
VRVGIVDARTLGRRRGERVPDTADHGDAATVMAAVFTVQVTDRRRAVAAPSTASSQPPMPASSSGVWTLFVANHWRRFVESRPGRLLEDSAQQFTPAVHIELGIRVRNVRADGVLADDKCGGDLPIREAAQHKLQDLSFLAGERPFARYVGWSEPLLRCKDDG